MFNELNKVSRMSNDLWSDGEAGFIAPSLGNVVALGEGRRRADYESFVDTRRKMIKNYKSLKANSYQRERFQKETASGGRSGGELGRGNNQVRARRKKRILKEWGNGSSTCCGYCGARLNYGSLELEKLVPEIGYDTFENLAPCCRGCNASMHSKTFMEKIKMVSKDSPTVSDVHVPAVMGSKKKRDLQKKKMAMEMALRKGSKEPLKDPKGGLTAAGRAKFNRETGSNLKPGVRGKADTPEKMRRKGSFLTRFFTNPSGPMVGENGKPTRLALSAAAWGEPVPKNRSDAAKLAEKGRNLLERYKNVKKHENHNQATHGNRGGSGVGAKVGRSAAANNPKAVQIASGALRNFGLDENTVSRLMDKKLGNTQQDSIDWGIARSVLKRNGFTAAQVRDLIGTMPNPTAVQKGDKPGHPFRGNQWTGNGGRGLTDSAKSPASGKGKPRPKAPTKAGEPQLKTKLVGVDAKTKAKAAQIHEYMKPAVARFKNPNVRKYAQARAKQMTSGVSRPSGMSKKYGLDKKTVISTEVILSKIFRAGREKFSI